VPDIEGGWKSGILSGVPPVPRLGTRDSGIQDSRDPPVFDLRKRLPDSPKGLSGKSDLRKYRMDKVRKIWCITES
jgi:hypothetical protein